MANLTGAYGYAVGAMLLWGVWGILANYSLDYMDETSVLLITYTVAIGVILVLDPQVTIDLPTGPGLAFAIGTGVTMCLGAVFYYKSVNMGNLSIIPAIPALYFVVTTVYGVTVLEESVNATQVAGVVLAVVSIVLLTR
jgi:transporter family protein